MSQFITTHEIEDLDEWELHSKFTSLTQDVLRTQRWQYERALALASLETVEAQLNRKRAMKSTAPTPML